MRQKPHSLIKLEILSGRMTFDQQTNKYYSNLANGFQGETAMDQRIQNAIDSTLGIYLVDLNIKLPSTRMFQIDSLLITKLGILLLEIKNYRGQYESLGDRLRIVGSHEFENPLVQMRRSEQNFERFLTEVGHSHIQVQAFLLYANRNFQLYNMSPDQPIILEGYLETFLEKLRGKLRPIGERENKVAKAIQTASSPFPYTDDKIPSYTLQGLRKGLACPHCKQLGKMATQKTFYCSECDTKYLGTRVVQSNISDFITLFDRIPTHLELNEFTGYTRSIITNKRQLTIYRKSQPS